MNASEQKSFNGIVNEVRALFHRLAAVADELHSENDLPASQRAIIENLGRLGARTVPQLASMRPVSRQHIQIIVNQLLERELVELVANPAHKRSSLVQLTATGSDLLDTIRQREAALLAAIDLPVGSEDMKTTLQTLSAIRRFFTDKEWRNNQAAK